MNVANANHFLLGGTAVACWAAGVFFLRFYRTSRDRLFLYFALALWTFGAHWTLLSFAGGLENQHYLFGIRAIAFLLLIFGIVQKNRGR